MPDNTQRFSDRVSNYIRFRPDYPADILSFFQETLQLRPPAHLADIGSGTGKLTHLFLAADYVVTGVEPNDPMRLAAESLLADYPNFNSVSGTAEQTTLPDRSVDGLVAGQAFHWFAPAQARQEFRRILKPGGWVVLIWNDREITSPFLADYEQLLRQYGTNYTESEHRNLSDSVFDAFFGKGQYGTARFANQQAFDFPGLLGRYLSSSFAFTEGHPLHADAVDALKHLFEQHQQDGRVRFDYQTKLYYGKLDQ